MVSIYILLLTCNKYYIGKSKDVLKRIEKHFSNRGSAWTKKFPPIKVVETIHNCDNFDEDKYTLQYMNKYGIDNVRGGSFTQIKLRKSFVRTIKQMLLSLSDKCFICKKRGHFAKDCNEYIKNI